MKPTANAADVATFTTTLVRAPQPDQEVGRAQVALLPVVHADPPTEPRARNRDDRADPALLDALPPFLRAFADHPSVPATFAVTPDTAVRLDGDPEAAGCQPGNRRRLHAHALSQLRLRQAGLVPGLEQRVEQCGPVALNTLNFSPDAWAAQQLLDDLLM